MALEGRFVTISHHAMTVHVRRHLDEKTIVLSTVLHVLLWIIRLTFERCVHCRLAVIDPTNFKAF